MAGGSRARHLLAHVFAPTLREVPKHATCASHQLMLRAGLIRQSTAGIYSLLPMAVRTMEKVCTIIHEEMESIGAQRLALPCLTPAALWQKTGRWDSAGEELIKLRDRKGADFCLGPTHEEAITGLAASALSSYKQLPWMLYQLDRKFRDEARPRAGLLRGREFWMKDLYTFDATREQARHTYELVCGAYTRIFARMGLPVIKAEADTGNIGGESSHEYHISLAVGDDAVLRCGECDYAANLEKACGVPPPILRTPLSPCHEQHTKLDALLKGVRQRLPDLVPADQLRVHFLESGGMAVFRADRAPSETKLRAKVIAAEEFHESTQPEPALESIPLFVDVSALEAGSPANGAPANVQCGDFAVVEAGDGCPRQGCGKPLQRQAGLELGHAFLLGTRYAEPMGARFVAEDGSVRLAEMGCYGIGVSRILAAAVEHGHDSRGIVWPAPIAPFRVCIVTGQLGSRECLLAEQLYDQLHASPALRGDVILDNGEESLGEKMKRAELMGFPWMVVVGGRATDNNMLEVHTRCGRSKAHMTAPALLDLVSSPP